jgi:EAL domain-containing protein (putative c-di-GMP-specific phosphodiesterase class I)
MLARLAEVCDGGGNEHDGTDQMLRRLHALRAGEASRSEAELGHGARWYRFWIDEPAMATTQAEKGVRRALADDQLVLFYQPIHELESRTIVSAEALLRARRANGEIRSATKLAEAAEESSAMYALDSWLVRSAYADAASWQKIAPAVHININLSPREFQEGNLVDRLDKLLSGCGTGWDRVNLEITETSYIEDPKETMHMLDELKERGLQLWLDDFGTGHSSIEHVKHFPLDGIKIPGEFVKDIPDNKRSCAITRSIIALAHDVGMSIIAEGVEREEQLDFLRDLGANYIQGFLFSKPMPIEEFITLLSSRPALRTDSKSRDADRDPSSRSS